MWQLFSVMVSKDWEIHLGHIPSQATVIWAARWYIDPGLKKNISLKRWVEWEDMNTVIKGAKKCAYFCLRNVPSVMETISIQLCTLLYFAKQVLSFLTTGISGSSGLPSCIYLMAQRACWNTGRHFLVRKPCQICLLPDACHQATGSFFFFNRTLSRLPVFPDLWQSGLCFLSPKCTFSCCLFSSNFQMWLHIHFISSTLYPFLNFCIIAFHATFPLLLYHMQMNSRNLLQLLQI